MMTEQEIKRLEDIYLIQSTIEALHVHKLIAEIRRLQTDVREISAQESAQRALANAHMSISEYLQKQIADAPTVFANPHHNNLWLELLPGHIDNLSINHTHTAKLVEIKKIGEL
jgi:hypothetical protein